MKKFKTLFVSIDGTLVNVGEVAALKNFRAENCDEFREFLFKCGFEYFAFTLQDIKEEENDK